MNVRWTPRAKKLGAVLTLSACFMFFVWACFVGLAREDRWRCENGVVEACYTNNPAGR